MDTDWGCDENEVTPRAWLDEGDYAASADEATSCTISVVQIVLALSAGVIGFTALAQAMFWMMG